MFEILSNDWLTTFQATYGEPENKSIGYERAIAQEQLTADKKAVVEWLQKHNESWQQQELYLRPTDWQQLQKECE